LLPKKSAAASKEPKSPSKGKSPKKAAATPAAE
ncbi:hypothetical protein Tco_1071234, partial [Tanacetum coccineum]